mmetsp:Transcript_88221/g.205259  ORF Transcript_88221/g.205259 Transcript_88221/m.205259 type:complete len:89 (+) Transcript_88221:764-1030(+)
MTTPRKACASLGKDAVALIASMIILKAVHPSLDQTHGFASVAMILGTLQVTARGTRRAGTTIAKLSLQRQAENDFQDFGGAQHRQCRV